MVVRDSTRSDGFVVIVVAITAVTLIVCAAFVVDLVRAMTHEKATIDAANKIGLSALAAYVSAEGTHQDKLDEAVDRAEELMEELTILGVSNPDIGIKLRNCSGTSCNGGEHGYIQPGRYYTALPDPLDPLSSECLNGETEPCFVANNSATDDSLNAIRIELTPPPVELFLSKVINYNEVNVAGRATVAQIPRKAAFLVDLSRSITDGSDLVANPSCFDMLQMACVLAPWSSSIPVAPTDPLYPVDVDGDGTDDDLWFRGMRSMFAVPTVATEVASEPAGDPDLCDDIECIWWGMGATRPTDGGGDPEEAPSPYADTPQTLAALVPFLHYRDDYDTTNAIEVYNHSTDATEEYYLREYDGSRPNGAGEPLISIINSIKYAVDSFKARSVPGDEVAVFAFDEEVGWDNRSFELGDDFDTLSDVFDIDSTDADDNPWSHFLFPRYDSSTNLPEALLEAANALETTTEELASKFVVVFTDGKSNCHTSGVCNNSFFSWETSMLDIDADNDGELSWFIENEIPVHWVIYGRAQHTLNLYQPGESGDCASDPDLMMSDADARNASVPLVYDGGLGPGGNCGRDLDSFPPPFGCTYAWADANSGGTPFWGVNFYLYKFAVATRGYWLPIRGIDPGAGPGVRAQNAGYDSNGVLVPIQCEDPVSADDDPFQMQMFDPEGRTIEQQIADFFDEVMGDNPFLIMEDEGAAQD